MITSSNSLCREWDAQSQWRWSNAHHASSRAVPRTNRTQTTANTHSHSATLRLPALAFVHGQRLKLVHDPRAHLHHPMPVPQQLSQIPILRTRYPDSRKTIFHHQLQQKFRILAVGLLLLDAPGLDLCWIADPQLDTELCQQPLEPA